jgi:hypothetical protein
LATLNPIVFSSVSADMARSYLVLIIVTLRGLHENWCIQTEGCLPSKLVITRPAASFTRTSLSSGGAANDGGLTGMFIVALLRQQKGHVVAQL